MTQRVTLIPGDGITAELVEPVIKVIKAAGADVEFIEKLAGRKAYQAQGTALPEDTIASVKETGVALKGKILTPRNGEYGSPASELRKRLDLYASVRPIRNLRGVPSRHADVDIRLIRESTEDVYAGLEHHVRPDVVTSMKVVTAKGSERIARYAFEYARSHDRDKVTLIHKANIMKKTDGLFIESTKKVAADYDDIAFDTLIVDNACMQLMLRPHRYDVVLAGNLYGDIFSDLGAGIVGGIAPTTGALLNDELAVFEAIHGDASHLVGQNKANPIPMLLPACWMLEYIGQEEPAGRIMKAISDALEGGVATPDLGGTATTSSFTDAVIERL